MSDGCGGDTMTYNQFIEMVREQFPYAIIEEDEGTGELVIWSGLEYDGQEVYDMEGVAA